MKKLFKQLAVLLVIVAIIAGALAAWKYFLSPRAGYRLVTETIGRGDLAATIGATGTVEPEELVNVGAQVGGMVTEFGHDASGREVDYGSQVKAGMKLAQIDDSLYQVALREAQAEKLQAAAAVQSAEADIKQSAAKLTLAESNWKRAEDLWPKKAIARNEYDACLSDFVTSKAAVAVSEAMLATAKAKLASAEAAVDRAERNLGYCVISSPVDGVIIDRRVSIGQTVNSSMSAPSLFLIAKDLRRMQVWVSVNEADVGSIKTNMPVVFTVDTFPDRKFVGTVHKVRLNATMSQNVVTFVVEVATDNSDGTLLPYLTATVKFIREQRKNVLTVSNAALRFLPDSGLVGPADREIYCELLAGKMRSGRERVVWVDQGNGAIRAEKLEIGIGDGVNNEVLSGGLNEGDLVVTAAVAVEDVDKVESVKADAGSPFLPKMPHRRSANKK
ncbi:MAG: efflux RND transporter periplasmic adaptor subunit [Victivallaceae bacterium]|nr:efflux RND transporter periplasmic adaptor subunit [Victivallaceae bacterium]